MNRLPSWTAEKTASSFDSPFENSASPNGGLQRNDCDSVDQLLSPMSVRQGVPFQVFSPLHYEKNYEYPLVVWLHGPAANERQLLRVMPKLSARNYVGVAPRGIKTGQCGFDWPDSNYSAEAALERILDAVESAKSQLNIAANHVYLVGYQSGGTVAMRIALKYPDLFAGFANIGGHFPRGDQPLRNLDSVRRTQLLMMFGEDSPLYGTVDVCSDLPLFHAAGLKLLMRQYPGDGELTTQMLHDLNVWIMERVTGQTMDPAPFEPGSTSWN